MATPDGVLDASVILAVSLGELSVDEAEGWLTGSCISAVNLSEVIAKLVELGYQPDLISENLAAMRLDVRAFDEEQAERAGLLRVPTKHLGISFGDRACLALAATLDRPAITADRIWTKLDLGIEIALIR